MQFSEIKLQIAENIGYDDGAGAITTGGDITEAMLNRIVNRKYYDLFTMLAEKYPEDHTEEALANFYKDGSTVSSGSSTTLTINDAAFTSSMIGDKVYNSTQGVTVEITAFTSTTVVTVDAAVDDWDSGDTVFILGYEFPLGGDATDSRYVTEVGVKYSTSDTEFIDCDPSRKSDVNRWITQQRSDFFSQYDPVWYPTSAFTKSLGEPSFTGSGLNDLTVSGTYTGSANATYYVEIDGASTPDTFKWSNDNGSSFEATTVAITGAAQTLENGISITFAATTGHTSTEYWTFAADAELSPAIGIRPQPTVAIANGIKIRYVALPAELTNATDKPQLPMGSHHVLVAGGTMDALRRLRMYEEAREYREEWIGGMANMIGSYAHRSVMQSRGQRYTHYQDMRRYDK
jgi:hypothetical protein